MQNPNTFKDFPAQSHIELKFSGRDQQTLEREEALQKYRKNVNILTKIFSYDPDREKTEQEEPEHQQINIDPSLIEKLQQSQEQMLLRQQQVLEQFKSRNQLIQQKMKESLAVTKQEEFDYLLQSLQQENLIDESHPFLDPKSSYYLKTNHNNHIMLNYDICMDFKNSLKDEPCIQLN
ncbi:hypothetical protein pb186bvf_009556 [Paramecium bursaria]